MKNVKAVFKKQLKDTFKNPATLIQFIIFPLLAFAITRMIDFEGMVNFDFEGMTEEMLAYAKVHAQASMPNMTTMQATVFAGMGLIPIVAGIIAEDIEKKSLRFLMMAGVKPSAYLLGIGGVVFIASFFTSVAFSLIGEFREQDFWIFLALMMSGVTASIVLGATIGILTKNQQAATGLSMPIALILGFGPIMAQFNDNIARWLHVFYTQQLNVVADYLTIGGTKTSPLQSFAIMWANVAVLGVLFVLAYKKGLKA